MTETRVIRVETAAVSVLNTHCPGGTPSEAIYAMAGTIERMAEEMSALKRDKATLESAVSLIPSVGTTAVTSCNMTTPTGGFNTAASFSPQVSFAAPDTTAGMPTQYWAEMRKVIRSEMDTSIEKAARGGY
jgi:hypothetical protein